MTRAACDSGPLTHLWQIRQWSAFETFESLHLPEQVVAEVAHHVMFEQLGQVTEFYVASVAPDEIAALRATVPAALAQQEPDLALLALARRIRPDLVLTDDLVLRRAVEALGHTPMGSVGILLRAYRTDMIDAKTLNQAIDALLNGSTLYLSPLFKAYVRRLIAEATSGEDSNPP